MEDGHNDNALWENQLMRNSKNEVPNFPCHAIGEAMCSVEESNLSDSDFFLFSLAVLGLHCCKGSMVHGLSSCGSQALEYRLNRLSC